MVIKVMSSPNDVAVSVASVKARIIVVFLYVSQDGAADFDDIVTTTAMQYDI